MKVILFGGTTEGGKLAQTLAINGVEVTLFVATEYAERLLPSVGGCTIIARRINETEMIRYFRDNPCDVVIDATHPYARLATHNIRRACETTKTPYRRLLRSKSGKRTNLSYVANATKAAELLRREIGNVFLAVGSNELEPFTTLDDFTARCYVRILPMIESLQKTVGLGFRNSNIICMQGPFDEQTNRVMLRTTNARFLITKDSGDIGGFEAKINAAEQCGCRVIVLERPEEQSGFSFDELCGQFGIENCNGFNSNTENTFFPLFVDMKGKRVLIVGGGNVAERRAMILRKFGASITIITPEVTQQLAEMIDRKEMLHVNRKYDQGDIERFEAFLTIAATDCRKTNAVVAQDAINADARIIVSDCREKCNCYFPAIAQDGTFIAGLVSKTGDHRGVSEIAEQVRRLLKEYQP